MMIKPMWVILTPCVISFLLIIYAIYDDKTYVGHFNSLCYKLLAYNLCVSSTNEQLHEFVICTT